MSVGSVNTNTTAYIALQSLNQTSSALGAAQQQISTGSRVADATDDGGAFAVVQKVRSDVSALTSVKQQLGTQVLSIANQAPQALLSLFK